MTTDLGVQISHSIPVNPDGWTGLLDLGGLVLPLLAGGEPRRVSPSEVLLPPGAVSLLHPFGDTDFFRHGWNSWSPSGWRCLSDAPLRIYGSEERLLTADDSRNDTPQAHSGSGVGALRSSDGRVLILGALGLGAPRVGATPSTLWGNVEVKAGEWFLGFGDEVAVFSRYAQLLADHLGSRDSHAGRVWCSWYSYYEGISEAIIEGCIDDLGDLPFDVIQLDDGWERAVGDWQANDKFAAGMATTAQRITASGRRAGLWLAPFIALPSSVFACERRDLLIHDGDGEPMIAGYNWGGPYYCLDTTHPEVQDHLRTVFKSVRDWGFSYLKLDFVYAAALEGRRYQQVHREQAYREAIALIREIMGEDAYLLGCGAPMLPSMGIFDGVRVGPDVAAFWENAERPGDPSGIGAKNAFEASIHRQWLRPVFETDPDVVFFRRRRSLLDDDQRQMLQDLARVLGFLSTSDPMPWLSAEERAELRAWLLESPMIEPLGSLEFRIDGRIVDFNRWGTGYVPTAGTVAG
ncbi:MAG: alpha-galactosidase [Propionibacteriaceae bacterium]|jgi:alpha-galactosidase|nr:alpha-galactosidase [Propionibacteriaceae bacterium]